MNVDPRLRELVGTRLAGRNVHPVEFVDELLLLAAQVGTIHCSSPHGRGLRFEMPDQAPVEIGLDHAPAKLRMILARLGELGRHAEEASPTLHYGGETEFEYGPAAGPVFHWRLHFANTPAKQQFTLSTQ